MNKIQKALRQVKLALIAVQEYFEADHVYSFEDNTEKYWQFTGNKRSIAFDNKDWTLEDEDAEYSYELYGSAIEKSEYTLMHVDNGCGDRFYIILDNSKRIDG